MIARVYRVCPHCRTNDPPHSWEILNPATSQPYRRGRVVFTCLWSARRRANLQRL